MHDFDEMPPPSDAGERRKFHLMSYLHGFTIQTAGNPVDDM